MAITAPPELKYGYVVGKIVRTIADDIDADFFPDTVPASGQVTFKPAKSTSNTTNYPAIVMHESVTGVIQESTGELYSTTGDKGVWLVVGVYDVVFNLNFGTLTGFQITVTEEHTKENPLDLALYRPTPTDPATKFVVNEQVYVNTLKEADRAEAEATRAKTEADRAQSEVDRKLTDLKSSGQLTGPRGLPGKDGSNSLPTGVAVMAQDRLDFVEEFVKTSGYSKMKVRRKPGGRYNEILASISDSREYSTVTWELSGDDKYRVYGDVSEKSYGNGYSVYPEPNYSTVDPEYDKITTELTLTGDGWNTNYSSYYTDKIGDSWSTPITTQGVGAEVYIKTLRDYRGGLWKAMLLDPSGSNILDEHTYTTHALPGDPIYATTPYKLFSVDTPGDYLLKADFIGADPNATYTSDPRGWVRPITSPESQYAVRVSEKVANEVAVSPGRSNKNFAFRISHVDLDGYDFVPYHGQDVETVRNPPVFYDGVEPITDEQIDQGYDVIDSFSVVQSIFGHTSSDPNTEVLKVETIDTLTKNGLYNARGVIETLTDLKFSSSTYIGMMPFSKVIFDRIVTSYGSVYQATSDMDGSTPVYGDEGINSTGVLATKDGENLVAAVRWNSMDETRRVSRTALTGSSGTSPMFIEHRSEDMGKIYPRIGYNSDTVVPAGSVFRWSVDYWMGRAVSPSSLYLIRE